MTDLLDIRCPPKGWGPGWYFLEGGLNSPTDDPGGVLHVAVRTSPEGGASAGHAVAVASDGRFATIVLLHHPASEVRVAISGATAQDVNLQLRPIGTIAAATRLLLGLRGNSRTQIWRRRGIAVAAVAAALARRGVRHAGDVLFGHYLASMPVVSLQPDLVPAVVSMRLLGRRIAAQLRPLVQLEAERVQDGDPLWHVIGTDPQFVLERGGVALELATGWYRVRLRIRARAGRLVAPCLYPDYGQGYEQGEGIALPLPDANGLIETLIVLRRHTYSLRFDPSIAPSSFAFEQAEMQRIGRARALGYLLGRQSDGGDRDWPAMLSATGCFIGVALRDGLSTAVARLQRSGTSPGGSLEARYGEWVRTCDALAADDLTVLSQRAAALGDGPLISVLVPVYQTPEHWLRRCLDSVLAQAYPHWELCIADDASPAPHVRAVLGEYAARDERIKVAYREVNGHIARASNTALGLARGEYVALLDHDDELRPHALLEVAERLVGDPALELVYTDEDKIDEDGRRFHPYFKPDWNPDLLLSQNYLCHLTVIRTARVLAVGGFRPGYEGSQDHDLVLRCIEGLSPSRIHHIPKILYHWRAVAGSTALERSAKDYAASAGARAVADHLQRSGTGATVDELGSGYYRVCWPLPEPAPKVSLIVPTRDRVDLLRLCVESVFAGSGYQNFELVVVDNQSSDPATLEYLDQLRQRDRIRVLVYDAPFNYSAINNWAAAQCDGVVLGLLNNDVEVIGRQWLDELVAQAIRPQVGVVGAMLYYPDCTIQHAGVILGLGGVAAHAYAHRPQGYPGHGGRALVAQNLSAVTGACLFVRRDVYMDVGGLDEGLAVAFNDIDFCLRVTARGYRNVWTPFAELLHHESASRGKDESEEKSRRFAGEVALMEQRWGQLLRRDPAYNPNLSLEGWGDELAFPPRI